MLTIYHSNHLDLLKELLIELLKKDPLPSPLANEHILVQSPGMASWLRIELAKGLGIAAGFDFPLPASFLWQMYTHILPDVPKRSAFNKEGMTWKLMELLDEFYNHPAFAPLNHYLANDDDHIRRFQLAGKIADIFDQYLVYRPHWIQTWERDHDLPEVTAEQPWQPILWRALVKKTAELGQSPWHRANMHHRFGEALKQGQNLHTLPKRLFIFGISALPPHFVESLQAIGQHVDVHLLTANPSAMYWGDEKDSKFLRKLAARQLLDAKTGNPTGKGFVEVETSGNPLLGSMGKLGRDYFHQLHDLEAVDIDLFVNDQPDTLLGQLQKDIFLLEDSSQLPQPRALDSTLQLHSCHSPLREVEVLHDRLLAMFEADPTLTPKDVVVMLPDVDSYTPWIQAVFSSITDERRIPYAISDLSAKSEHPLLSAFNRLLSLEHSRCTAPELLELLEVPAIRNRWNLSDDDTTILRQWTHDAGIRWGLNPQHQQQFDLPSLQANSWLFGIRRMLLGYAMPEAAGVYQDILPLESVKGMSAQLAGALADFIDAIEQLLAALQERRSSSDWIAFIHPMLERFFAATDDSDEQALLLIHSTLANLHQQLEEACYEQPLTQAVLMSYLNERLSQHRSSQRFLAGQLNFCTLMPMRAIPFKVVCLLGMNDGAYPRTIAPTGFDLIAAHPQRGDRSRREDDRYLFLEALLSAQQTLYISYVGRRISDNTPRIPSVLVSELLDYCQQGYGISAEQLTTQHPLKPFSAEPFRPSSPLFSYAKEWLSTAHRNTPQPAPFTEQPLPVNEVNAITTVELQDLVRFFANPCRHFFNRRLQVWFRSESHELAESEAFALDGLENYQLRSEMLNKRLDQHSSEQIASELKHSGRLPHHAFGELWLDQQLTAIEPMVQHLLPLLSQTKPDLPVELDVSLDNQRTVTLTGWINHLTDTCRLTYQPSTFRGTHLISHWVEHVCLCAIKPTLSLVYALSKGKVDQHSFATLTQDEARRLLPTLLTIYFEGMKRPLPWFAKTGYDYAKAYAKKQDDDAAQTAATNAFYGSDFGGIGEVTEDLYIRRVYPELEPVFDEFRQLTQTLLTPALDVLESQEVSL